MSKVWPMVPLWQIITYRKEFIQINDTETYNRIVAYLDSLRAKVDALKKLQAETATELNTLLPSILDKAFKGEL